MCVFDCVNVCNSPKQVVVCLFSFGIFLKQLEIFMCMCAWWKTRVLQLGVLRLK